MSEPADTVNVASIKQLLQQAKLPETTVRICLRGDLQAQFEQAERELAEAQRQGGDSLAGNGERVIAERIEALRREMVHFTAVFRLRAMPQPAWKRLCAAHPPRKNEDGSVDERDKLVGINVESFFEAVIRGCVVEPALDDEDWRILLGDTEAERDRRLAAGEPVEEGKLTDRQFDGLADAAWALNRHEVDVPFSRAASRILGSGSE